MTSIASEKMSQEANGQIRILIVDDDTSITDVLKDIIAQEGREIGVCHDGLSAVEQLQRSPYDVLILDLMLPGVEGLEVFKVAKKVNPQVLVVIITGYATLETAIAAIKEGAYDFIQKPFKLDGFKITIDNAIEKVKLNKENRELLGKLRSAYEELSALKETKGRSGGVASLNFLSDSMPSLLYLYEENRGGNALLEKMDALVSLKEKGLITDPEFRAIKGRLLQRMEEGG